MRHYDPNAPLIALHIPKTAGTSIRRVFKEWFGSGLLLHYHVGKIPPKHDIVGLHRPEAPVVVYGHFNSARGFGVADYYPTVRQFVTILRDPFEKRVSRYFYWKSINQRPPGWTDNAEFDLRSLVLSDTGGSMGHFPAPLTMANYRELINTQFVEIGVTEYLEESLARIGRKLGRTYEPHTVPRLNVAERDEDVPSSLREEFVEQQPLEYAVYNYVRSMYETRSARARAGPGGR